MSSSIPFDSSKGTDEKRPSASLLARRQSSITDTEMEELINEFWRLDADGNGEISIEELQHLLRAMRSKLTLSGDEIDRALKQIDKDGDGVIDISELLEVIEKFDTSGVVYKALHQRSLIRKDFERFDKDKRGFITKDQLVHVIKDRTGIPLPKKHIDRLMKDCDGNGDDQIDYEEFVTLMTKSFMVRKVYGPNK